MAENLTSKINKADDVSESIITGHQRATEDQEIAKEAEPCSEVLRALIAAVQKDGLNVENELTKEGRKNPTKVERSGKFIQLLEEATEATGRPLRVVGGRVCYFNGKCWDYVDGLSFEHFLTKAAAILGVDRYTSVYYDFIAKAAQSFQAACWAAVRPVPSLNVLNCQNGTVIIGEDGQTMIKPHDWRDGLLYVLPYKYDPDATAPKWSTFLDEVLPDENDRANLQEYCGSLFAKIKHEKLCYLYGATGRNGKTTAKDIICAAIGAPNVSNESLDSLTVNGSTGEAARAALEGKLLNACGEVSRKIESSKHLKDLASREPLSVRPPYQAHTRTITNYARLLFCANALPVFADGAADAEKRRFLFIEFSRQIPAEKVKLNLADEIIRDELPGVLNWIIEGLKRLQANKGRFTPNPHSERVTAQFLEGANSVYAYLQEYGLVPDTPLYRGRYPKGHFVRVDNATLYGSDSAFTGQPGPDMKSYSLFCAECGRMRQGRNSFLDQIRNFGFCTKRTSSGRFVEIWQKSGDEMAKEEEQERIKNGKLWNL